MKHIANTVSKTQYLDMILNNFIGHQHEPLSFRSKIILFFVLLTIISSSLSSILICYFCCKISNNNNNCLSFITKDRKTGINFLINKYFSLHSLFHLAFDPGIQEIGAAATPLLS